MLEWSVKEFLDRVACADEEPGGGCAAALAGSLAAALTAFVVGLTQGREKFASVEEEMIALESEVQRLRAKLESLIEEDVIAFRQVMAALRMPKETEEQKVARSTHLQRALIYAAEVTLETAENAVEVLKLAAVTVKKGNPAAVSDAGVAVLLARSAVEGAAYNVEINLTSIKDTKVVEKLQQRARQLLEEAYKAAWSCNDVSSYRSKSPLFFYPSLPPWVSFAVFLYPAAPCPTHFACALAIHRHTVP